MLFEQGPIATYRKPLDHVTYSWASKQWRQSGDILKVLSFFSLGKDHDGGTNQATSNWRHWSSSLQGLWWEYWDMDMKQRNCDKARCWLSRSSVWAWGRLCGGPRWGWHIQYQWRRQRGRKRRRKAENHHTERATYATQHQRTVDSRIWHGMDSSGIIPGIYWNWASTYAASYIQFQRLAFIPCYGSTCRKQNSLLPPNFIPTLFPNP